MPILTGTVGNYFDNSDIRSQCMQVTEMRIRQFEVFFWQRAEEKKIPDFLTAGIFPGSA